MGTKDRNKKKRKPPPRRKRRPADSGASATAFSGKGRPGSDGSIKTPALLRRLRALRIVTGKEEHPADVAVAEPHKADQRDPDWAADVDVVREALQLVASGKDTEARDALRRIPRRSPLSQWRLFVSGLSEWYAGNIEQAESAWRRLDRSRRPARIAAVLRRAGGSPAPARDASAASVPTPTAPPRDEDTLENRAAVVRALRFERPALEELAEATSRRSGSDEGEKFPLPLVDWLASWRAAHGEFEPDLITAAQRNALALAFEQPEAMVFAQLSRKVPGAVHDPRNRLYMSRYLEKFLGAEDEAETCREVYMTQDLPNCKELSQSTRAAIASLLHLETARESRVSSARGLFGMLMGPPDTGEAEDAYKAAIKAYPANRTAHREYVDFIRRAGDFYRETKKEAEARDRRLRRVMERWSKSLPDDVEPRLWLVNHYLENEELQSAQPHVKMLQRQRLQDPRVRALPWRWTLFESMRLARHKKRVAQAREQLDEAESQWPEWLCDDWIPFLRAALAWRAGETDNYERLRNQAVGSVGGFPLLSNIMLFAAARRMHIPSGDLKPLRQSIADLMENSQKIELTDLLKTGSFLWDLDRTEMLYTGYRAQGPRLIQELSLRLSDRQFTPPDEPLGPAALWCAGNRFASDPYSFQIPAGIEERKTADPLIGASVLRVLAETRFPERFGRRERETFEFVKRAAETTSSAFYRHYFQSLVDDLAPHIIPSAESAWFEPEADELDAWGDEDDEWPDEEELCDCIDCRRARGELGPDEDEDPAGASARKQQK